MYVFVYAAEGAAATVRFFRIGEKVISREKLADAVDAIFVDREAGATQEEAARAAGVTRSVVSFLESLGEVRRGPRVALVGFPVANVEAVREVADRHAVDFVLVMSQSERETIEAGSPANVFNRLLETLATLRDFDTVLLVASDWRIATIEKILGGEVVGISLGSTPLREDREVDVGELDSLLAGIMARPAEVRSRALRRGGAVSGALRDAADEIAGRWQSSRRS